MKRQSLNSSKGSMSHPGPGSPSALDSDSDRMLSHHAKSAGRGHNVMVSPKCPEAQSKRPRTSSNEGKASTMLTAGDYEIVPLAGGGFKRRRNQAAQWQYCCHHGRIRSRCKECGGASICDHGRERNQCKQCGGAAICQHGRRRTACKQCGGASICEHGRERYKCKPCGGCSICVHGRRRYHCKECRGSATTHAAQALVAVRDIIQSGVDSELPPKESKEAFKGDGNTSFEI